MLKKEGTLWLNIGDTYWGGKGKSGYPLPHEEDERYRQGKTLQHGYQVPGYMEMRPADGKHDFIQPKCLCMIPERLAWSLIQSGWILRNKNIWHKRNAMPSSVKNRFSNRWEYVYMFSKSNKSVYWTNEKTLKLVVKQPLGINGKEGEDWEWRKCPNCEGRGKIKEDIECSRCSGSGKIKFNFWTAHDYYFDLDGVRDPHKYDGRKDTMYKGGPKDVQIGKHERWPNPEGKNPGDIIADRKWNDIPGQVTQSIARDHGGWFRKDGTPIVDFEKGKNPGDFWDINTQPFPEAHFAVFPETLCRKPIKAGCPEQVCKKCGKARERITEKKMKFTSGSGKAGNPPRGKHEHSIQSKSGSYDIRMGPQVSTKTIGWTSCNCNAGFEPGIVLDPFAGAGTVGVVAKSLGRRFILIDIKKEYMKMAKKRVAQVGHQKELFKI